MNYYHSPCPMCHEHLFRMYPQVYFMVYPQVKQSVDNLIMQHGTMYSPSSQEVDGIIDRVYDEVQLGIMNHYQDELRTEELRVHRRRFLRDLVGILLISELLGRTGNHHYYHRGEHVHPYGY